MSKQTHTAPLLIFLGIAIALLQVFDLVIHAATNQLEFLRVSSNLVILVWLTVAAVGRLNARSWNSAALYVGAYLVLNTIFLAVEGVTRNGEVRTTLFLLVFLTVALSALLVYMLGKPESY